MSDDKAKIDEDLDDAWRLARQHKHDAELLMDAGRTMFNALGRFATRSEKDQAQADYFDLKEQLLASGLYGNI